jgi:hypothetical protein
VVTTLLSCFRSDPQLAGVPRLVATLVLLSVLLSVLACGGSTEETIDRQVFIDTWVELRIAALETDSQRIAAPDREAVLDRHEVTADDLTRFAEVHATDLDFMRDVWNDIELRMDRPVGN